MRFLQGEMRVGATRDRVVVFAVATLVVVSVVSAAHIADRRKDATVLPLISSRMQAKTSRRAEDAFAALPLSFEPNQGQANRAVRFVAHGQGYTLLLTRDETVMAFNEQQSRQDVAGFLQKLGPKQRARFETTRFFMLSPRFRSFRKAAAVRIIMKGANPNATEEALDRLPGTSSYFLGRDPRDWHRNIPTYAKVQYDQIYPGVDLVYYGNRQRPEFDFVLAPHANPKKIKLLINARGALRVTADGSVQLAVSGGLFELLRPCIYQTIDGKRRPIRGGFVLKRKNQVGIELAKYDRRRALIIDPTLSYSTYFGGNGADETDGIAVDSSGNMYVAGTTTSTNLPTAGGYQGTLTGTSMVFVSKLDSTGATLLYSTYLGGSADQNACGIAVDGSGNAYIAGSTTSSDFPVVNGFQNTLGGTTPDAFIARINTTLTDGASLVYSTYLGGGGNASNTIGDAAFGIAINGSGDVYVVGQTTSDASVAAFPTTANAYQSSLTSKNGNAFLTEVNTNLVGSGSLLYSTYLGGNGAGLFGDYAMAVAVNSSGDAFLTGQTSSNSSGPFPTTSGAYQSSLAGADGNAFVSEINPSASGSAGLLYSTYLGGSDSNPSDSGDEGDGIAVDTSGYVYISGSASSSDFPTTTGAYQIVNSSVGKAVIAKLNTTLSGSGSLIYSTFLGGSNGEVGNFIAVDSSGDAFIVGATYSADFPTTTGAQQTKLLSSNFDGYFAEMNPGASALLYSTFLGGSCAQGDSAYGVALDSSANAYVSGITCSSDFPVTKGAYDSSLQGAQDGFIAKFSSAAPTVALSPAYGSNCPSGGNCSLSAVVQPGQTATYDLQLKSLNGLSGTISLSCSDTFAGSTCSSSPGSITLGANQISAFSVKVATSATTAATPGWMRPLGSPHDRRLMYVYLSLVLALLLLASISAGRSRRFGIPVAVLFFAALLALGGCAETLGTRSGTVVITATSPSGASSSASLTLTVS